MEKYTTFNPEKEKKDKKEKILRFMVGSQKFKH